MSEALKHRLAQTEWDRPGADLSRAEMKVEVTNEVFEQCLSEMPDHHKASARKRGFIRATAVPFFFTSESGMMYRHGITNIVNKDAEINKVHEELLWERQFLDLVRSGVSILSLATYGNGKYRVTYTNQRYNFDD